MQNASVRAARNVTRGMEWIQRFVDAHLSRVAQEVLGVAYAGGETPAAVRVCAGDRQFRLQPVADGRNWILATDEAEPRVLEVFDAARDRFQDWLLVAVAMHAR